MYVYQQSSGKLTAATAQVIGDGYSGFGYGKNNPSLQHVADVGPIPEGEYTIGEVFDSPDHGPLAMPLTPDQANEMFGRAGFLMHGDSLEHPGEASKGCIIMPRAIRAQVAAGSDRRLMVTA